MNQNHNEAKTIVSSSESWLVQIGQLAICLLMSVGMAMGGFWILIPILWVGYFFFINRFVNLSCDEKTIYFSTWGRRISVPWTDVQSIKILYGVRGKPLEIKFKSPHLFRRKVFVRLPFFGRNREPILKVLQQHIPIE
jgi:hypothetical protein